MKFQKKPAYQIVCISLICCTCCAYWMETSYLLHGDVRFATIIILYALAILLCILSTMLFVRTCIREHRKLDILLSLCVLLPLWISVTHSVPYVKDMLHGKIEMQTDIFLEESFHSTGEKKLSLEYEGKEYWLRLTDAQYEALKNDPPDTKKEAVPFGLLYIYHATHPIRISFYEYTGIISTLQVCTE